ncbi:type II toxin-antitoxin system VapC family toxin [Nitrosomonas sp. Nm166]|uniref:type II toxin-antitoxin system VapC family toxin n=1 Tax=Nitrosomonas sp. Nm166 TaxID=1881054 RepID=UPI0008EDD4F3|nr:type II toxin-antitoxin system VapC family toxin [Nitrosomonas sp. Nm166]SFE58597.1 PIN domain nuclease, a component of toxin-antitoxin system (PIN domain) [Nitrosomonas sp. Nm166]
MMRLLLDTHILLWALDMPERLPYSLRAQLESPSIEVYFSAASIWEIAIKAALGKVKFHYSAREIADGAEITGFIEIPVSSEHAAGVAHLPMLHADPFDRLLIAQALAMPARFITADATLASYSELVDCVEK